MRIRCTDCGDYVQDDESGREIEYDQQRPRCCSACDDDSMLAEQKGRKGIPWDIDFDLPAGSQQRQ